MPGTEAVNVAVNVPLVRLAIWPALNVPPLHAMLSLYRVLIAIRSVVSGSLKVTVPVCVKVCALASKASVNSDAVVALMLGESFVPVIVTVTS